MELEKLMRIQPSVIKGKAGHCFVGLPNMEKFYHVVFVKL
jgi:hypothetical protein